MAHKSFIGSPCVAMQLHFVVVWHELDFRLIEINAR